MAFAPAYSFGTFSLKLATSEGEASGVPHAARASGAESGGGEGTRPPVRAVLDKENERELTLLLPILPALSSLV